MEIYSILLGQKFIPSIVTESALVILDRFTGELLFDPPITDDSVSTVNIGPDGSVYVSLLGTLTMLSTEKTPTLGLIKFSPN